MSSLITATGGEAFYRNELSDVARIARQVTREIRDQSVIGYQPSNKTMDGTFRKTKVTVKAAGNPSARTRTGYFATVDQGLSPAVRPRISLLNSEANPDGSTNLHPGLETMPRCRSSG